MDSISRLRSLLGIVDDRSVVDDLQSRVAEAERRANDVAEVLPDAFVAARRDERLAEALRTPIEDTLHRSITENPKDIADVLFPVMGPAIRRSIAETLRSALEGLNQAMQLGFSRQGLRWRFESWRTGVPFREVVLRHTMLYRVKEAFLIHRNNGLLIARAGEETPGAMDRDAVAAMLTAIEDFVADSTGSEEDDELSSAELGGRVLWVISGYAARMALVLEGTPPLSLRLQLRDRLALMHQDHGAWMENFEGDHEGMPEELEEELQRCLLFESSEPATRDQRRRTGMAIALLSVVGIVVAAYLIWTALQAREAAARWSHLQQLVSDRPGLVWIRADRDVEPAVISVLHDPTTDGFSHLGEAAGFPDQAIRWQAQPYMSAEPAIVLGRIESRLGGLPEGVTADVDGQRLAISGDAGPEWIANLESFLGDSALLPLVDLDALDTEDVPLSDRLRQELTAPDTVSFDSTSPASVLVRGSASQSWRVQAEAAAAELLPEISLDWGPFESTEAARLKQIGSQLHDLAISFGDDLQPVAAPQEALASSAELLREAKLLAPECGCRLTVAVVGCTDETGSTELNSRLRQARAQWLASALGELDVDTTMLALDADCADGLESARKAYVDLRIEP